MDLLGSILNSMDGPPKVDEKQKQLMKKHKEQEEKARQFSKNEMNKFQKYVEERVGRFVKDDRKSIQFQPLDKIYRAIIHDVSSTAGMTGVSYGIDGVDRYIVVYKKEHLPSEDEILARRNGENWTEDLAGEYARRREQEKEERLAREVAEEEEASNTDRTVAIEPKTNYKAKYVHLIGEDAALEAAKKTESNKSYGFVPSANKRDVRSIEQTMADIQAKKRLKKSSEEDAQKEAE